MLVRKTTLTATVMFGTQQFLAPGFIDNLSLGVIAGYNRTFGRGNEVAVTYDEMHYSFSASQQGFSARGASILYGRPINRKLIVELSVAPMAREAGSTTRFFFRRLTIPWATAPGVGMEPSGLTGL